MFSSDILIMVSAIAFCIGGLIGAIVSRTLIPPKQQKDLQNELSETKNTLESYQQDVAQHFVDTSNMVNKLSKQYKDVHEHLAKGAMHLTNPDISRLVIQAGDGNLSLENDDTDADTQADPNIIDEAQLDQPKDWSPQKGALSEEYGLEKSHAKMEQESIEVTSAKPTI